jgi:hypothetical protein
MALNFECRYAECHYTEFHYAECWYAECHYASVTVPSDQHFNLVYRGSWLTL